MERTGDAQETGNVTIGGEGLAEGSALRKIGEQVVRRRSLKLMGLARCPGDRSVKQLENVTRTMAFMTHTAKCYPQCGT